LKFNAIEWLRLLPRLGLTKRFQKTCAESLLKRQYPDATIANGIFREGLLTPFHETRLH